jgi:hypothetical protein
MSNRPAPVNNPGVPTDPGTIPTQNPPPGAPPSVLPPVGAPTPPAGAVPPIGGSTQPTGTNPGAIRDAPPGTTGQVDNPPSISDPYDMSASDYLKAFRLDRRFTSVPRFRASPVHHVMLNMERLYDTVLVIISTALLNWNALRDTIPGTAAEINQELTNGAAALSSALCLQVYNLLRIKFYTYDSGNSNRYRNRCILDRNTMLPTGIHWIVEHFGMARPTDVFGNVRYLHHWDNQEPDNFGLPPAKRLNATHLQMICASLKDCGVPFRRMQPYEELRTPWDSLFVSRAEGNRGFNVMTTFPESNYKLFEDAFMQIKIGGITTLASNDRPLQYYGPRAAWRNTAAIRDDLKRTLPANPDAEETAQFNAAAGNANLNTNELLPVAHLTNVHPTGLEYTTATAPDGTVTHNYRTLIYGRGFAGDTLTINSVIRGVTDAEVDSFFNLLIRKGI